MYDAARGKNSAVAVAANGAANGAATNAASSAPSSELAKAPAGKAARDSVRVLSSIEFLQGGLKVYETKPVVMNEVSAPDRKAVVFQIDLPLQALKPGFYVCQVNVVDDVAGNFAFPRSPILIKEAGKPVATSTPAGK